MPIRLFLFIILALPLFVRPSAASENVIFSPTATAEVGAEISYGFCPCARFAIHAETISGKIETRNFVLSIEKLLEYRRAITAHSNNPQVAQEYFTVGALELLLKGKRIGLGFTGVTFGEDLDRGYSEILRTGAYVLMNLIRSDEAALYMRHGYEFEQLRVNAAPAIQTHNLPQTIVLAWSGKRFQGEISASVGFDPIGAPSEIDQIKYGMNAALYARLLSLRNSALGIGLQVSHERDPMRLDYGMEPENTLAGFYVEIKYQGRNTP